MAQIGDKQSYRELTQDARRAAASGDEALEQLLKDMRVGKAQAADVARLDLDALTEAGRANLQRAVADQLKGQLPPHLAKALVDGKLGADLLTKLLDRVANTNDPNATLKTPTANSPESARQQAKDGSMPEFGLRWAQFVQKAQHVPGLSIHSRSGVAGVKGEGTTLIEMLSQSLAAGGAGLRTPGMAMLATRDLGLLSPEQRAVLLEATFGPELAGKMAELGIQDPLQLVRAGAMPEGRAELALALDMPRGRLLAYLMRAELLKIGPGNNGELGIRPEFLAPLKNAGIGMLGTLAALRALSHEELNAIYQQLRLAMGGLAMSRSGGRPVLKRDLLHWARVAARRPSEIMLLDREAIGKAMEHHDAQELVQAWYLENLFWEELARRRGNEEYRIDREERERQRREREEQEERDQEDAEDALADDLPEMRYDEGRNDDLVCFWISDYNTVGHMAGILRRMYVCIDPGTGALIPQHLEAEYVSA